MLLITRTQGLIAGASHGARRRPHSSPATSSPLTGCHPRSPRPAAAWSNLASRWGDLTPPDARLDRHLMRAAAEVRAAYRELTHDTTTLASLEVIATRPGLPAARAATLHAIESGSELAYVVAEKADTPNLTGQPAPCPVRAHNDVEAGLATPPARWRRRLGLPRRHPRQAPGPTPPARRRDAALRQ